jgi:hypothetical protein
VKILFILIQVYIFVQKFIFFKSFNTHLPSKFAESANMTLENFVSQQNSLCAEFCADFKSAGNGAKKFPQKSYQRST